MFKRFCALTASTSLLPSDGEATYNDLNMARSASAMRQIATTVGRSRWWCLHGQDKNATHPTPPPAFLSVCVLLCVSTVKLKTDTATCNTISATSDGTCPSLIDFLFSFKIRPHFGLNTTKARVESMFYERLDTAINKFCLHIPAWNILATTCADAQKHWKQTKPSSTRCSYDCMRLSRRRKHQKILECTTIRRPSQQPLMRFVIATAEFFGSIVTVASSARILTGDREFPHASQTPTQQQYLVFRANRIMQTISCSGKRETRRMDSND